MLCCTCLQQENTHACDSWHRQILYSYHQIFFKGWSQPDQCHLLGQIHSFLAADWLAQSQLSPLPPCNRWEACEVQWLNPLWQRLRKWSVYFTRFMRVSQFLHVIFPTSMLVSMLVARKWVLYSSVFTLSAPHFQQRVTFPGGLVLRLDRQHLPPPE